MKKYQWITSLMVASFLMQGAGMPVEVNPNQKEVQTLERRVKVYPKNSIKKDTSNQLIRCSLTQPIPVMESVKAGSYIKEVITAGTPVTHVETLKNGWIHVKINGEDGYISVSDAFVIEENEKIESKMMSISNIDPEITQQEIYYNTDVMNLRAQPEKESESLAKIPAGTHLYAKTDQDEWILVEYEGKLGWVNKSRLNVGKGWVMNGVLIVNKGYALSEDFNPGINPEAKKHLDEFIKSAKSSGHELNEFSNFRTFSRQTTLFTNYSEKDGVDAAETYSARPGHSEHQTGLAFDIGVGGMYTSTEIGDHPGGIWMKENAHKYGFIMSYPEHKTYVTGYQYEPWHFRYVGKDLAKTLYENNQTLDEYFGTAHPYYKQSGK